MIRTSRSRRRRDDADDGLFVAVVQGVLDGARETLGLGLRRALRRGAGRAVLAALAAVTWAAALVLLLGAAVDALEEIPLPASLAGLSVALLAGLAGWALWRAAFRRRPEPE